MCFWGSEQMRGKGVAETQFPPDADYPPTTGFLIVSLEPRVTRFPDKMCSYNLDRELTSEQ